MIEREREKGREGVRQGDTGCYCSSPAKTLRYIHDYAFAIYRFISDSNDSYMLSPSCAEFCIICKGKIYPLEVSFT